MSLIPVVQIMRPEVEHLLNAEQLSRQARRLVIPVNPAGEPERFASAALIDDAIAHLVAARQALFPGSSTGDPVDLRMLAGEAVWGAEETSR